jgi:hypothetical protein
VCDVPAAGWRERQLQHAGVCAASHPTAHKHTHLEGRRLLLIAHEGRARASMLLRRGVHVLLLQHEILQAPDQRVLLAGAVAAAYQGVHLLPSTAAAAAVLLCHRSSCPRQLRSKLRAQVVPERLCVLLRGWWCVVCVQEEAIDCCQKRDGVMLLLVLTGRPAAVDDGAQQRRSG